MAYLASKIEDLEKALISFEKALQEPYSEIVRDACIQRFEYTHELAWKSVKLFLEKEGLTCSSPRSCFRTLRTLPLLSEEDIETFLQMSEDRNISVHTYSEETAATLYTHFPAYASLFKKLLIELKNFSH